MTLPLHILLSGGIPSQFGAVGPMSAGPAAPTTSSTVTLQQLQQNALKPYQPRPQPRFFPSKTTATGATPRQTKTASNIVSTAKAAAAASPKLYAPKLSRLAKSVSDPLKNTPAPSASVPAAGYTEPDFTARPQGEADHEGFLFGEMLSQGRHTPAQIVQSWENIQERKDRRLTARSNYFASLIQDRHRADLQRRNQHDVTAATNLRAAIGNMMQVKLKEAELRFRARQFNAKTKSSILGQAVSTFGPTAITKEMREASTRIVDMSDAIATINKFQAISDEAQGMGAIGDMVHAAKYFFNMGDARTFEELRNKIIFKIKSALGSSKLADSDKEAANLMRTVPGAGADQKAVVQWVMDARRVFEKHRRSAFDVLDSSNPNYGESIRRRIDDMVIEELNAMEESVRITGARTQAELKQLEDETRAFYRLPPSANVSTTVTVPPRKVR